MHLSPAALALAIAAAMAIGLSLGLLGGGGSILTVPVLVYVLGVPTSSAVAMSMPVVGLASLVGAVSHWRAGRVRWGQAMSFGAVAMVGAFGGTSLGRALGGDRQLLLLALLMAVTAVSMWRRGTEAGPTSPAATARPRRPMLLAAIALGVGLLTGIVGIGGGFLVVPALVLFGGLSMSDAVGTSLVVIALNAGAGLAGYAGSLALDWRTIGWFTMVTATGILAGTRLAPQVPAATLRRAFAVLLLLVGSFLLWSRLHAAPRRQALAPVHVQPRG